MKYCVFQSFDYRCVAYSVSNLYDFLYKNLSVKSKYYVYVGYYNCKSNFSSSDVPRRLRFLTFYLGGNDLENGNMLISELTGVKNKLVGNLGKKGCSINCGVGCNDLFDLYFIKAPDNVFMNTYIIDRFLSKIYGLYVIIFLEKRYYR